ncbi:LysR family transcriptional regulator [Sphingobium sp.]|uniref:LysR family transcriptional regulator n=1 Tax=Sphingobium sp. TaxID=1912891 RepID=UPI000DB1EBC0|nr:LysR family transcriptional regulator [Sphingobium sp.]PZU68666.1 MAG: LysR family transcriptional regulator [Sphingobium sp.]
MHFSPFIEFRHLRYFAAASEHGSFRKAGEALGVQESTISRRIRDLEDQMGASLFHRHRSGVRLTFAGERFLEHVCHVLETVGEGVRNVASIGKVEEGHLRIGKLFSLASGFLPCLLQAFGERHSGVQVDIIHGSSTEHMTALRQFHLDIAFVPDPPALRGFESEYLWSERLFVVLPSNHPLAAEDYVLWPAIMDESFLIGSAAPGKDIRNRLIRRFAKFGRHARILQQSSGCEDIFSLVALGRGVAFTSEATTVASAPGIVFRPMANEFIHFNAVWLQRNDNPAFRRLLSIARTIAKQTNDHNTRDNARSPAANGSGFFT